MVAMYKTLRTSERPPQIWRFPCNRPLSQLKGATPTKAATFLRSIVPGQMLFNAWLHGFSGCFQTVLLHHAHFDELATTAQQTH